MKKERKNSEKKAPNVGLVDPFLVGSNLLEWSVSFPPYGLNSHIWIIVYWNLPMHFSGKVI